jgi:predicted metal-binding membrane protein
MPEAGATALRRVTTGRTDALVVAGALGLAAVAWVATADRMAGMDAGPGTALGGVGWFTVSWLLMMAAMMLPALTPMVVAYGRRSVARPDATATFAFGYMGAWVAAGLAGYGLIEAVRSFGLGWFAWHEAGRYVAAGVIVAAGLYQLAAAKAACLSRCRDHATFLRDRWRGGRLGALRMGGEHGAYCIGCCWAMMAALFALGVMSLPWMALMAVLISAERVLPRPAVLGVALVLVALGAWVALAPGEVPGLTVPDLVPMHAMPLQ